MSSDFNALASNLYEEVVANEDVANNNDLVFVVDGIHSCMRFPAEKTLDELSVDDFMQLRFILDDETNTFYTLYGKDIGFGVLKNGPRKKENNDFVLEKASAIKNLMKMKASEFEKEHNHSFAKQDCVYFVRSNRQLSDCDKAIASSLRRADLKPSEIMSVFTSQSGSYNNIGFIQKDLQNFIDNERIEEVLDGDAQAGLAYLQAMSENLLFFHRMDANQNPTATVTATGRSSAKLRLMCSYGGHITTRPNSSNLSYLGGETRIIAVPRHPPPTLSSLISHLASSLHLPLPLSVKYLLPPHTSLDSLISLLSDDDVLLMLEEVERLMMSSSTSTPDSRLRLFVFPGKVREMMGSFDAWFSDALKGVKLARAGNSTEEEEVDEGGGCDSIVLETSSSFGSTASSMSNSNFPAAGFQDSSVMSENRVLNSTVGTPSAVGVYQDTDGYVSSMSNMVSPVPVKSESPTHNPCGAQVQKTTACGYYPSPQHPHAPTQQELQFVPAGYHYLPNYPTNISPAFTYYTPNRPQQTYYQNNQPYPVYLMPSSQMQPYAAPMHPNIAGNNAYNRPPLPQNASMVRPRVAYVETSASPVMDIHREVDRLGDVTPPLMHEPFNENQQHFVGIPGIPDVPQSFDNISSLDIHVNKEHNDDPAYAQIYKSQPPPPLHQTMSKTAAFILSDALTKKNELGERC